MVSGVFFRDICALEFAIFFHSHFSTMKRTIQSSPRRHNETKKINTSSVNGDNGKLFFFVECKRALLFVVFSLNASAVVTSRSDDMFARRFRFVVVFSLNTQARALVVTSQATTEVSARCLFCL